MADAPPIWMTQRRELDALLLDEAGRAGCTLQTGQRIAEMDALAGRIVLADRTALAAPLVIAADGANSTVAKALFGRAYDPGQIGFALEVDAPRRSQARAPVEIDLGAAAWGYGWAFPKTGAVTLGVGGVHRRNPEMRATFERFAARHGVDLDVLRCKGAFLPFGEVRAVPGKGRVLLAGDAAGLVDPITGEGIAWAMKSGALAGSAAARAHRDGRPDGALRHYSRSLRPIQAELRRARALRWLAYQPWLQPAFLKLLASEPGLQRRYLALLSGDLDYADLGWRALPRLGWRLLRRRSG
jgi:flavin-dependent dehydrogenase